MPALDSGRQPQRVPYSLVNALSLLVIAGLFNACNVAKHLPAKERLYMGTDIIIQPDSTVSKEIGRAHV